MRVEHLDKVTLVKLLQMYDSAVRELKALNDPSVAGLLRQMESTAPR